MHELLHHSHGSCMSHVFSHSNRKRNKCLLDLPGEARSFLLGTTQFVTSIQGATQAPSIGNRVLLKAQTFLHESGAPILTTIFGKYLVGRRFEIQNFRNICCKISCLPASPRIFEHLKYGITAHFNGFLPLKGHLEFSGAFFLGEIFEKVSFDPYNFRITRLLARKSEKMKNF